MPKFTEKSVVEDYLIDKLQDTGWKFLPAEEQERESLEETLLISNLTRALRKLNSDLGIGDDEIRKVLNELKLRGTGIEGSKQILNYLKFGVPVMFEKERVVKYVQLFDFEDSEKNEFIVSRQVRFHGKDTNRLDIVLYVNGIPLVDIECKDPTNPSENWYNAYKQVKEYEKIVPELYKYVQIGIAAEQVAKYFPIVPWLDDAERYEWKGDKKDPIDDTLEMLSPSTLLDIIRNYCFFKVEFGQATKIIARYMQYRASEKMVKRVIDNLRGVEKKNKGLIWHWQGSGKTEEMIFAANKLYHMKELENPSIFFIVDRLELEEQLYRKYSALEITKPEEPIGSIEELRRVLRHDGGRGKRGIMITLIHKFRTEELVDLQKELEEFLKNKDTIVNRKNVIAFVDEGHRTQYGLLATQMRSILKNAFFFALTGTPISKRGRDTYLEFSYPPEEKYLDRYSIVDSIEDGFTLRIFYQPRLEREVHLKKDMLETFLETEYEELPEEVREKVKERVKKKLNSIKLVLENQNRIEKIAKDIAEHFKENLSRKFKAMIVAASRKACVLYKRSIDRHLPWGYSEVVMSYTAEDPKLIKEYHEELKKRYPKKEDDEIAKELKYRFSEEEEEPKVLIVTDMLLTGFDAPILQTMYLDKPLKEHRLLQAIARTNRPYKDVKGAGMVIDYIGILKEFRRAFEIYSKEEIRGALDDVTSMREEFDDIIDETLEILKEVPKNKYDRGTLRKATEILTTDVEKGEEFSQNYRRLRKVFELLGPDKIKLEQFFEYKWISGVYTWYMRSVGITAPSYERYVPRYFDKTVKFVQKTTEFEELERFLPVIKFDENYLRELEQKVKSTEERAANIVFTLNRFVLVERYRNPIYESLVERVERILSLWRKKAKDFNLIYKEGSRIVQELQSQTDRRKQLRFSDLQYSLLLTLEKRFEGEKNLIEDVRKLTDKLKESMFAGWIFQKTARKRVEKDVRLFLRKYVKERGLKFDEYDRLHRELMKNVVNYGKVD